MEQQQQKKSLSVEEQESIAEAVLRIVASYPGLPETVTDRKIHLDDLKDETNSIGISPEAGAVVLKKYVSGSFEAQFPFSVYFKCNPTSNESVIGKRRVLEGLSKWMEEMEYPPLSDGRRIQSIERISSVILAGKDRAGNSVFQCRFTLKYFRKRS